MRATDQPKSTERGKWASRAALLLSVLAAVLLGVAAGWWSAPTLRAEGSAPSATSIRTVPADSRTDPPLPPTLSLQSSRKLCTANTLTELSWKITGGVPPYALTIEGEKVDPSAESHRVNCGPLQIDPKAEEPLPNQTKKFAATLTDSRAAPVAISSGASVGVKPTLPAPIDLRAFGLRWSGHARWNDAPGISDAEGGAVDYLVRTRLAGSETWRYGRSVHRVRHDQELRWHDDDNIKDGSHYQIAVAAIRDAIEQETPEALQWTKAVSFYTVMDFQNVEVTSTYSTITVSWDTQPGNRKYRIRARNNQGGRSASQVIEGPDRTEALITRLRPDTNYSLDISIDLADNPTAAVYDIPTRTMPAPPGYRPPTGGPTKLEVSQTDRSITATWDPPYEGATSLYRVELNDPETGRRIGPPRVIDETTFTYHGLVPLTRYEVETVHLGTVIRSAKRLVTTWRQGLLPDPARPGVTR